VSEPVVKNPLTGLRGGRIRRFLLQSCCLTLPIFLICHVFNDADSNSDYMASNKQTRIKDMEGSSRGLLKDTILAFVWRDRRNLGSPMSGYSMSKHLSNTSQKFNA
jgi:hypothetical protein